jgi:hypothetical protein
MARTVAGLPEGTRLSDLITLGMLTILIPRSEVRRVLREEGRESQRERQLPAHVVVYYVIALSIYMHVSYGEVLRCLVEGLEWLGEEVKRIRQTGRSAISQARTRLGPEPMERLYREVVRPVAVEKTRGAWYRSPKEGGPAWRLVSIDGSTLDVPDEAANRKAFGRPGSSRGQSAFPKLRLVSLVECGTHVLFGAVEGPYRKGEATLAREVIPHLEPEMLCIADRNFFSYDLWKEAAAKGCDLLWRVKVGDVLPRLVELEDGSYFSKVYPSKKDRERDRGGLDVRVVEYVVEDELGNKFPEEDPFYRVITTVLDPVAAPARDFAALYHERWEIESAFDELKTHLRGKDVVLRSKTPDLVRQEFYGLLLAHYAVRAIMHEAALQADVDADELSFVHSVRVIRRKLQAYRGHPASDETQGGSPFPPSGKREPA